MDGLQTARQGMIPASRRRSLWRNHDFLLLWSGQTVSTIGTQASQLAFALLVLFLTHSPEQAGLAGALRALPYFVLSLPVGALIDRWNRKRVMVLCDCGRAMALGSIPVAAAFHALTVEQLYLVALLEGTLFVFFDIAEVSCLPQVVSKEELATATARNQAAEGTSYLLGPAVGGVLYAADRLLPFLADALSYTISVVSLLLIRTPFQGERRHARHKLVREVREGLIWLWRQPLVFFMALLSSGINFLAAGTSLVVILLAQRQGASSLVIGAILGIAGIGSIAGALIAPQIQRRLRFGRAIALSLWANALLWPPYALAPSPLALGIITALLFVNGPIYNVVNIAYRLALVPDELQGRVNSVVRLISLGAIPPGLAVAGFLLQHLGAVTMVMVFAPGYLFLALAATFHPAVRHARPHVQ
jgi:predicted MFS family arabinose efflux permease